MKNAFKRFTGLIDARNLRERALLFIAGLVGVFMIWQHLLMDPLNSRQERLSMELDALKTRVSTSQINIQTLAQGGRRDPDAQNRQRLSQLQDQLRQMDETITRLTDDLIAPRAMARVLEDLLHQERGLQLVSMQNHLHTRQLATPESTDDAQVGEPTPVVYQHGLTLEFTGSYEATLRYLKRLEGLSWAVFFDELDVQMEHYPKARVRITVYTLSLEEGWLRV